MKSILVVAPYVSLPGEPTFNRFLYLCYQWAKAYEVTLVTSAFCHFTKTQRVSADWQSADLPFQLVLIDEPGYRNNVSAARYWSHRVFHRGFSSWLLDALNSEARFDIVYSAFPLISTNLTLGALKREFEYKLIIDIQDIWPDSICGAIPFLKAADFLLAPLRDRAHKAYGYADGIVAVSQTYLAVALERCSNTASQVTYLGADYSLIEAIAPKQLASDTIRLVYIGTLSHSYDIETVIRGFMDLALPELNIALHILGDGPDRRRLEAIANRAMSNPQEPAKSHRHIFFHGYLPYPDMIAFVKACQFTVNPIVKSAAQSITNKLSDYIALGLPILSSQRNEEARRLVEASGGYFFEAGSPESFCAIAQKAILTDLQKTYRAPAKLPLPNDNINALFNRQIAYPQITQFIKSIAAAS